MRPTSKVASLRDVPTGAPRRRKGRPGVRADVRAIRTHLVAALILLVPIVLVAVSFWPGHMNADTLIQIDSVRTGNVGDRHAWLLVELWRLVWPLGVGTAWVLTGTTIAFVLGSYLVLRVVLSPIAAAVGTAVVALLPQNFGSFALVGRDMWFTALLLLAFGLLVQAAERCGRVQIALLASSAIAAILAQSSRQNAITAMVVYVFAFLLVLLARSRPDGRLASRLPRPGIRRGAVYVFAAIAAPILVAGVLAIAKRPLGVDSEHPEQYTYVYDLAALSERRDRLLLPPEVFPANDLRLLEERFSPDNVTTIVVPPDPLVPTPVASSEFDRLRSDWQEAIFDSPMDYLAIRWDLFMRQIAVTQPPTQIYHPVIDGNPWGLRIRFPDANHAAKEYVEAFADERLNGNLLHATWLYILISFAAGVVLLRAPRLALKLVGLMAMTTVAYQPGLFLGAMGVNLRVEDPVRPVALLAAIVAAGHVLTTLSGRPPGPSHSSASTT